jgi:phospholipase C
VDLNPPDIFGDISNCTLRSVSWVIPKGQYSDHAKGNLGEGPSWVGDIVDAIGSSSKCDNGAGYWQDTAILITWDDWGGWYDHEAPSILPYPQGGYQLGFRVPFVAVSAYTPSGYINDVPHDFGDILRFIEKNFGLTQGALNFADNRGPKNDLGLFFDLSAKPRTFKTIKTALPASYFIDDKRPAEDPDDQ